jgi:asparagine synthase (glutamine-hydrolysing)
MSTMKAIGLSQECVAPDFRAHVTAAAANAAWRNGTSSVTSAAFREIPWSLFGLMASAKSQLMYRTPYLDNDLVGLAYRAPEGTRRSSDSALRLVRNASPKLGRIPTDRAVMADAGGLAYLLGRVFAEIAFKLDYMHKEEPPRLMRTFGAFPALEKAGLLGRHKWLPYRLWFQRELASYLADVLTDPATLNCALWNRRALGKIVRDHVSGTRNYIKEINAIITLTNVERLLVRDHALNSEGPH